jgi:phosphoglycerate dehydrogenase-like enzyme
MAPRVLVVAQLPTEWLEPLQAAGLDVDQAPEFADSPAALREVAADVDAIVSLLSVPIDDTAAEKSLRRGAWGGWEIVGYLGKDLAGARLGLVGFGGIGQAVASRAAAFDMLVHHYARRPTGKPGYVPDLDTVLSQSDVVSIHVPRSPQTLGLIDGGRINRMPRGSVLVNTSNEGILDEDALVDALTSGRLAGAGLDVFAGEPDVNPRLLSAPGLTLLPHIGSATWATRESMMRMACQGVVDVLAGRTPANLVTAT